MNHIVIAFGSHGQPFVVDSGLPGLLLDTKIGVHSLGNERVETIHLVPDDRVELPPDVPTKHQPQSGISGAAYDAGYGTRCALSSEGLIRDRIIRRSAGMDRMTIIVSSAGGTGTGCFEPALDLLRRLNFPGWIVYVHAVDPAVHPEKQTQRAYALARRGAGGQREVHFMARTEHDVREIIHLRTEVLEEMSAIAANIPGMGTEKSMRLLQFVRLEIDNAAYAEAVHRDLMERGLRDRFERGRRRMSHSNHARDVARINRLRRDLDDLLRQSDGKFSSMRAYPRRRREAHVYRGRARQLAEEAMADTEVQIRECVSELATLIARVGLSVVDPGIAEDAEAYAGYARELEQTLQTHTVERLMSDHIRESRSLKGRMLGLLGFSGNGTGELVERYLAIDHRYKAHRFAADSLLNLRDLHAAPLNGEEPPLSMPRGSRHEQLVDLYFGCESHESGSREVKRSIQDGLPHLLVEGLLPSIRDLLRLGFQTSSNVQHNKGIIISAHDAERVRPLVAPFFVPNEHTVALSPRRQETTEIFLFQLIDRWIDVPDMRAMIADVESRYANCDDRRLFVGRAENVWPIPLREEPGVDAEIGAKLLVMAYEVPGILRVLRQRGVQIELAFGSDRRHFPSFDAFCRTVAHHDAGFINERFYRAHFALDRPGCLKGLHERAEGIENVKNAKRLKGLQHFIGARRWHAALLRLAHEVRIADGFFT